MPTDTPNLNLVGYNTTTDSQAKFLTFRNDIAGTVNSNNTKIDTWAGQVNKKLIQLEDVEPNVMVNATWISTGYYEALVPKITAYKLDTIITFRPSQDNDGTTILKINGLDVKSLMKYDNIGGLKNLDPKDLRKNHEYQFRYDGTSWVWQGGSSADQTNIVGDVNNFIMIDAHNNLVDSGIDKTQVTKNTSDIGDITTLLTENKSSTVAAINENLNKITVLNGEISSLRTSKMLRNTNVLDYAKTLTKNEECFVETSTPTNYGLPSGCQNGFLHIHTIGVQISLTLISTYPTLATYENIYVANVWQGWKQLATTEISNTITLMNGWEFIAGYNSNSIQIIGNTGIIDMIIRNGTVTENTTICELGIAVKSIHIIEATCSSTGFSPYENNLCVLKTNGTLAISAQKFSANKQVHIFGTFRV